MATAAPETKPRSRARKADAPTSGSGSAAEQQTGNLTGRVAQVIGAVVDVAFEGELPLDARSGAHGRPDHPGGRTRQ